MFALVNLGINVADCEGNEMAKGHLEMEPLLAAIGIGVSPHDSGKRNQFRIKAERAGFNIMAGELGSLHVPAIQAERFKAWIKTFNIMYTYGNIICMHHELTRLPLARAGEPRLCGTDCDLRF